MKKICLLILVYLISFLPFSQAASIYQDTNRFSYGFKRVLGAPFQLPFHALYGTFYGPLGVGTVGGVLKGGFSTVTELVGGAFDMGAAAAPYAKYAVFI